MLYLASRIIPVFGAVHWGIIKSCFDFKGTASHAGGAPELAAARWMPVS